MQWLAPFLSPLAHSLTLPSGKYGDGSDVTTWKINFRCALNGLKDIVERRDLEEADCRVYQMLPSSSSARRRKRRRPGGFYLMDGTVGGAEAGSQGLDKDLRSRIELSGMNAVSGSIVGAQTPTLSSVITPTSGGKLTGGCGSQVGVVLCVT